MNGERKEVRRENKQVRSLKRLRTLKSKGKTDTKRFKRLKEKVYNPFPDNSPFKKSPTDPSKKAKSAVNNDPTGLGLKREMDRRINEGVKKSRITKQYLDDFSRKSAAAQKKDNDRKKWKRMYPGGAIEMTGHPGEYLMGSGAIGGFKTAKTVIGKVMEAGSKYAIRSAKNSIKPTSIGSNSL